MNNEQRKISWHTMGMLGALLTIWVLFTIQTDGTFLKARNLSLLARQMSVTAIMAVGMVLIIVCGQIDLSVGAQAALCGGTAAILSSVHEWPVPAAIAVALLLGAAIGCVQGALVAFVGIPAFIVTLGGMLYFQGIILWLTGAQGITPPRSFLLIGQFYIPPTIGWGVAACWAALAGLQAVRTGGWLRWVVLAIVGAGSIAVFNAYEGLPLPVVLVMCVAFVFWVLAEHTPFGRHLYAIGGNREAAFYSGIPIRARLVGAFTLMGLIAAIGGIVLTARVGVATADAGRMLELDAIAAAVIGGTSLMGGRGSVWGALLGAAVMASLDNGMSLLNTEAYWQLIIKGTILIAAVTADLLSRRKFKV